MWKCQMFIQTLQLSSIKQVTVNKLPNKHDTQQKLTESTSKDELLQHSSPEDGQRFHRSVAFRLQFSSGWYWCTQKSPYIFTLQTVSQKFSNVAFETLGFPSRWEKKEREEKDRLNSIASHHPADLHKKSGVRSLLLEHSSFKPCSTSRLAVTSPRSRSNRARCRRPSVLLIARKLWAARSASLQLPQSSARSKVSDCSQDCQRWAYLVWGGNRWRACWRISVAQVWSPLSAWWRARRQREVQMDSPL